MDSKEALTKYLDRVWGQDAFVFITTKTLDETYKVLPCFSWGARKEIAVERILALNAQGFETYYSPASYQEKSPSKEKKYVRGSRVLWADFDGNALEVLDVMDTMDVPYPSWRIQSGPDGHEHWYWELDEEYPQEEFEGFNKRIAYYLNADNGCWNADRVLRPPLTENHKKKYKEPPYNMTFSPSVAIVEDTEKIYSLSEFDGLPQVKESQIKEITALKEMGKLPEIVEVLAKYKWDGEHADLFNAPGDLIGRDGKSKRDEAMFRIAMHCAEIGMPDEAIYVAVENFDRRVGKFVGRRDREQQLLKFVVKARSKYPEETSVINVYSNEDIKVVYTLQELLNSDFKVEWLIDNFLPKGSINFISAQSGIGKSRLSMQLAYACAAGGKFLDWKINEPLRSLYLSLEMAGPSLKHFATGLAKGKNLNEVGDRLMMVPVGEAIPFGQLDDSDFIEILIKDHKPDIMFIDALGSLTLEALEEKQAKTINNKLKSLTKKYGITFFIIHHNRKDGTAKKERPTLDSIYGSQYVVTDADVVLTMHRVNENEVELIGVKNRSATENIQPILMNSGDSFEFTVADTSDNPFMPGKETTNVGDGNFFTNIS